MKFKILSLAIILGGLGFAVESNAATLVQVYQDALHNDPIYKQARATWMSQRELTPIARAALLPSVDVGASWMHTYSFSNKTSSSSTVNSSSNLANYTLTLTQPLFNLNAWHNLSDAKNTVKAAAATFSAASQDLILRTAKAYFDVLIAVSNLQTTIAAKNDYLQQLKTTREQYKVGLVAITPLYEAEASYDSAVASEISDRNAVTAKLEALRQITGHTYSSLTEFSTQVPLIKPKPDNIKSWVNMAIRHNYTLISSHYLNLAAMDNIKVQSSARLPVLSATDTYQNKNGEPVGSGSTFGTQNAVGLSLDFPIFSGGVNFANTKQARYDYATQYAKFQQAYSELVSDTRTDYLDVASGRKQILADAKSVKSNQKKVETTKASYTVGTNTMVDVLEAYNSLYTAIAQYTKDQYDYLSQTLKLKQDAGMLSFTDLRAISANFNRTVNFIPLKNGDYNITYGTNHRKHRSANTASSYIANHTGKLKNYASRNRVTLVSRYTIQLAASRNIRQIEGFISKQPDHTRIHIHAKIINGHRWYVATYGTYNTKQGAETALKSLPRSLLKQKPWVTKIKVRELKSTIKNPNLKGKATSSNSSAATDSSTTTKTSSNASSSTSNVNNTAKTGSSTTSANSNYMNNSQSSSQNTSPSSTSQNNMKTSGNQTTISNTTVNSNKTATSNNQNNAATGDQTTSANNSQSNSAVATNQSQSANNNMKKQSLPQPKTTTPQTQIMQPQTNNNQQKTSNQVQQNNNGATTNVQTQGSQRSDLSPRVEQEKENSDINNSTYSTNMETATNMKNSQNSANAAKSMPLPR